MEHNKDNHLKPTPDVTCLTKFLWEEKSLLIYLSAFELLKFEKWPQVVLRNYNFGEESSPVLSYSMDEAKTKMFFFRKIKTCCQQIAFELSQLKAVKVDDKSPVQTS